MWEHLQKNMLFLWDLEGPLVSDLLETGWPQANEKSYLCFMFSFCIWCLSVIRQFRKKWEGEKEAKLYNAWFVWQYLLILLAKTVLHHAGEMVRKKKEAWRFFFFEGWGFCPTSLQKSKTWWEPRATLENSNDLCYIINNLIGLTLQISTWSWLEITGPNQFYYWNSRPQVALWWPDVITQP